MNYDLIFALLFYVLILTFFFLKREKFKVQGKIILLYPTKIGLNLMDRTSKIWPKALKYLGYAGVVLGFIGMGFIFYTLANGAYQTIFVPKAPPTLAPVLPGVNVPGAPRLSFWHWIIAILITAAVHEFSHGVFARLSNVKIKSSGFALFGPILAAFVEPEEEQLKKIKYRKQLSVFAAGPFSNMILGGLFLILLVFGTGPLQAGMAMQQGVIVNEVRAGFPAELAELKAPFVITSVNDKKTLSISNFVNTTGSFKPGEKISIETDKGDFVLTTVQDPDNSTRGLIGISGFEQKIGIKKEVEDKYGSFIPKSLQWVNLLVLWMFIINIGIGLFNLLPLGPVDGGRMFYVACLFMFKDEEKVKKVWGTVSLICLVLILINMLPWISKLFYFLVGLF